MKRNRVILTAGQREFLSEQIALGDFKATKLRRAQILLGVDEHVDGKQMTTEEVVIAYGCSRATVHNTRSRFFKNGFDLALNGLPRPVNRKSKIDGRVQSQLIALRCSDPPAGESRWSLRLLSEKLVELELVESISRQGVSDVLKKLPSNLGE
jgi:hypothetical protein